MRKKLIFSISFVLLFFLFFVTSEKGFAASEEPQSTPIYSFWGIQKGYHFYTASITEKDNLIKNFSKLYKYEGIPWNAYAAQKTETVPVYRFLNTTYQYHFYTSSVSEKDRLIKNYPILCKYESVAWYAYLSEQTGTTPIYRLYSPTKYQHFFTFSPGENNCLVNKGWKLERSEWWVPLEGANVSMDEKSCNASLGSDISVGLWEYTKTDIQTTPFKISA